MKISVDVVDLKFYCFCANKATAPPLKSLSAMERSPGIPNDAISATFYYKSHRNQQRNVIFNWIPNSIFGLFMSSISWWWRAVRSGMNRVPRGGRLWCLAHETNSKLTFHEVNSAPSQFISSSTNQVNLN